MRRCLFAFGVAVALLVVPSVARAIIIEIGPNKELVKGYFISDDTNTLKIQVLQDGKKILKVYDRSKMSVNIIHQIKTERLEKLAQGDPKAYHDYAEALVAPAQKGDLEAMDVAMHLFLIAAHLDQKQFGRSSLVGMSKIATPEEARKFLALAFLLDPKGDADVMKSPAAAKPEPLSKNERSQLQELQKALKYYLAGRIADAEKIAKRPGMDAVFGSLPGMLNKSAFLQKCADQHCSLCNDKGCWVCGGTGVNQTYPHDAVQLLVQAELWVIDRLADGDAADKGKAGETRWALILQSRQVSPVLPLSLDLITDIDPRKCLYRKGEWVAPK